MNKLFSIFIILITGFCIIIPGCSTSPGNGMVSAHAAQPKKGYASGLHYEIRMPVPHTHYLEINITIEKPVGKYIDVAMPAWSPGRYVIYDFAKHIHHIEVRLNNSVNKQRFSHHSKAPALPALKRLDKQTWRITEFNRNTFTLTYKIYANYVSGTFSQLSSEGALLNGASVFMYPVLAKNVPVTLEVHLPPGKGWTIATALPQAGRNRFYADNYDHLIDSPLSIGMLRTHTFTSFGKPIRVCFQSPHGVSNGLPAEYEKILAHNCKILCDTAGKLFGGLPFSDYLFMFHTGFTPGIYDGMEHFHSSCITHTSPISTDYHVKKMTSLAAHELFHVWNIKCIRPVEFLSYDLTEETYTPSLWIVEGITRYFQNVLQLRAGLITREKFRSIFAGYITTYESKSGRNVMTLEEASLRTWFDRGSEEDTNRTNIQISYYNKGAVVGMLLDMKIRGLTAGQRGLEDVFILMYESYYNKGKGYTNKDFYSECEKIAGETLHEFFSRCAQSTAPLPYTECAGPCGFIIENNQSLPVPDTGIVCNETRIINIIPGSSAEKAGFQKYDEIQLVNGTPFTGTFHSEDAEPGEQLSITFLRYGKQMTIPLIVGEKVPVSFLFKEKPLISKQTAEIREAFYTGQRN